MEINKQLFEDVLSGKLKGTFVFRNQIICNSDLLTRNIAGEYKFTHPYRIENWTYTPSGMHHFYGESNVDIIDFIPNTNMKENELTIEIPDGKIVDWDESRKQKKIVLKDKQLTYEEICEKLFKDDHYIIAYGGYPIKGCSAIYNASNATTEHQLDCILAKNKLANVAKYLNSEWDPTNTEDVIYYLSMDSGNHIFVTSCSIHGGYYFSNIVFKSIELAQQAIEILSEETIKLALEPLGI